MTAVPDLSVYLAKANVKEADDLLKTESGLKVIDLDIEDVDESRLFVGSPRVRSPRWGRYFEGLVPLSEFGSNSATSAVLFARKGSRRFLIAFGQGHHLIDKTKIERNFGLRSALNLVDETQLRSIDKSTLESQPTQTREQTGSDADVQSFGVDVERDLLRALTGKPKDETLGRRIYGLDNLRVTPGVPAESLGELLSLLGTAFESDDYKNSSFAWVDHIAEVRDPDLIGSLDSVLLTDLRAGDLDRIWMTVPVIIDWNDVVQFRYSKGKKAPAYFDLRIPDFIESLGKKTATTKLLKSRTIYCEDADGYARFHGRAYDFVYAEIGHKDGTYILNFGKWYRVDSDYVESIFTFYRGIERYRGELPKYDDENEGQYNERATELLDDVVCLDKKNIKIDTTVSAVEPCDLFRDGKEFIHVKRYGGSSVLSHLFNQGLVSGSLFKMEPTFRRKLNDLLPGQFKLENPDDPPDGSDYRVVFAIVSESDEVDLSIPFFSMISLRHAVTRLVAFGYTVQIAKIAVEDVRRKTKKYQ